MSDEQADQLTSIIKDVDEALKPAFERINFIRDAAIEFYRLRLEQGITLAEYARMKDYPYFALRGDFLKNGLRIPPIDSVAIKRIMGRRQKVGKKTVLRI